MSLNGNCPKISYTNFPDKICYANGVDTDQTAPQGAVWSGSTLFAIPLSILRKKNHRKSKFKEFKYLLYHNISDLIMNKRIFRVYAVKIQIRVCICAAWSGHSLSTFIGNSRIYRRTSVAIVLDKRSTGSQQGPDVQSMVSLTSLLVVKMLTVLFSTISNSQVFLPKKCE